MSDQLHTLTTLPSGNSPITHWTGGCVGPRASLGVFKMRKVSHPCQIRTLYCLAHILVTILAQLLSWLLLLRKFHHKYIFNCSVAAWSGYTHMVILVTRQKQSAVMSGKWGGKCHISQARNGRHCKNFTLRDSYSLLQFNTVPHFDQTYGICYLACVADSLESPQGNVLLWLATLLP